MASVWFYMSFVSEHEGFLGGLYIQDTDVISAIRQSHLRGLNPGGDVALIEVPSGYEPSPEVRDRLLTKNEIVDSRLQKRSSENEVQGN